MQGLSQKRILENKAEIVRLLTLTKRDGIDKLISYLEKRDYFTAPASTQYHLSCVGGLAQHSLNVYYNMMQLYYGDRWRVLKEYKQCGEEVDHDNIIIVALLHDLCKVEFYKLASRRKLENGTWKEVQVFEIEEKMQILGHGSKSVIVAQQFIRLYFPEIQAISFHMGMMDDDKAYAKTVSEVFGSVQIALYVHLADVKATFEEDVTCLKDAELLNQVDEDELPFYELPF